MKFSVKKLTTLAMLAAIAYVLMVFIRIPLMPAAPFLSYDAKDVFFVIAGFLFGPLESLIVIILVCFLEMITVSSTGIWGFVMNAIASICFVLPAALIYRKKKTLPFAVVGLASGVICMTASMMLWNLLIVPIYMPDTSRADVLVALPVIFLPFNLIKASINMALTLIIYKPISTILHKSGILEERKSASEENTEEKKSHKFSPLAIIIGVVLLAICLAVIFFVLR
ncbi:MAG: ECF transporter S component [Lachnospiraceae bacterium]|nr:ECF transporter S component [Lachnospiraceae bacterium]